MHPAEGTSVKVGRLDPTRPSIAGRLVITIALGMTLMLGLLPTGAQAITRPTVIRRANHWIKRRVGYSQRAYHGGYRRDCSGFVSMAWADSGALRQFGDLV